MKWTGCEPRDVRDEIHENLIECKEREGKRGFLFWQSAVCCCYQPWWSTFKSKLRYLYVIIKPIPDGSERNPPRFLRLLDSSTAKLNDKIRVIYWTLTQNKLVSNMGRCDVESAKKSWGIRWMGVPCWCYLSNNDAHSLDGMVVAWLVW